MYSSATSALVPRSADETITPGSRFPTAAGNRSRGTEKERALREYTLTHFTFEEDLMESSGYPLSETHKMVHNSFVAQLDKFVEQHENGKDVTRKLMSMLQVWLTNHIKNDDKDYSSIVKEMLSQHEGWFKRTANKLFR